MKALAKAGLIGKVFLNGAKQGATSSTIQAWSLTAGLYQGLKYKGDFKNGVKNYCSGIWRIDCKLRTY